MTKITADRLTYLREYLTEKLEASADEGEYFLDNREDRIVWVSTNDEIEVLIITLQPAKIEVNG